jgi:hypothetical protein
MAERTYPAVNAHYLDTTLRVVVHGTDIVEFWVGEQRGRDYPRRAALSQEDALELLRFLAGVLTKPSA